jgi:ectoine hydroxylase-related dioxygenase (phytanoyl-CoA dioxygenase family)
MDIDTKDIVRELTEGSGYVVLPGVFADETVAEARAALWALAEAEDSEPEPAASAEPADAAPSMRSAVPTQKRVWNLLEKGAVFRAIAEEPRMLAIIETILGHDFVLSSIAGSILRPGAPRQEPHVDYPYWDLYDPARFPLGFNASFHIQVETLVMLDDFTPENGATAILPGSHKRCAWPDAEAFERSHVQATGPAGSLLMFTAPIWHAGRENRSAAARTALLSGYHCKFIRQLEDFRRSISPETLALCSERLTYLMGIDQPYPTLLAKNRRPMPVSRKDRAAEGSLPEYAVQAEARR